MDPCPPCYLEQIPGGHIASSLIPHSVTDQSASFALASLFPPHTLTLTYGTISNHHAFGGS